MTPSEFKAWFDGFTENVDKQPTQKQWARIKARVAEIDGKAVTERVYFDRYWGPYYYSPPQWTYTGPYCGSPTISRAGSLGVGINNAVPLSAADAGRGTSFNSLTAMNALGRADAAALN